MKRDCGFEGYGSLLPGAGFCVGGVLTFETSGASHSWIILWIPDR
jgi:hypothetical protein